MIKINLETESGKLDKMFVRISDSFKDLTVPLKRTGIYMVSSINKNFQMEGRPERWRPLSPMTLAIRRSRGGKSVKILQDTGHLKRSITYRLEGRTGVGIGTNVKYGQLHQFGGNVVRPAHEQKVKGHYRRIRGRKVWIRNFNRGVGRKLYKVPARPFLLVQDEDVDAIETIFNSWIEKMIKDRTKES